MVIKKNLSYYMKLNWTYTIEKEKDNKKDFFIIRVNELPGVCSDGRTVEEAMSNVKEAMEGAIELYLDHGDPVPEPIQKEKFKGNIAYRTTRERHYYLAKLAQQKHISMNKALDMIFDAGINRVSNHKMH